MKWGCVKNVLRHDAVSKMKGGPSKSACRSRLQTAVSCWSRKAAGGERLRKRCGLTASGAGERDERKRTVDEASKHLQMAPKPELPYSPRIAWRSPTYWPCGVRCIDSVTVIWALIRNLRT